MRAREEQPADEPVVTPLRNFCGAHNKNRSFMHPTSILHMVMRTIFALGCNDSATWQEGIASDVDGHEF
jgi:hypothetical protein